ncbi:MAG: hypothetical protein HYY17_05250 [Planctomycetes bacterium]|nr:hypothetical protein [Planctomycetota bacterium]
MHFQRFVKSSTKGIFIFIIAVMTVSLVVSFSSFGGITGDKEKGDAGVIFGNIKIDKTTFRDHQRRAVGHDRYASAKQMMDMPFLAQYPQYRDQMFANIAQKRMETAQEIKKTWETIVLLQDAKDKGIAVSDEEAEKAKTDFLKIFEGNKESEVDAEAAAIEFLAIRKDAIETFFREAVMMQKLLDLVEQSEFCSYADIYDEMLAQQKYARVLYVEFDPKDFVRDLSPIGSGAILKYYEQHKELLFKVPLRIQVLYLLADLELFHKYYCPKHLNQRSAGPGKCPDRSGGVTECGTEFVRPVLPAPDDKEIEKYWNENRTTFVKPRVDDRGPDDPMHPERKKEPKPPEYKTLQEAREDVIKRIQERKAIDRALAVMMKAEDRILASPKPVPETVFEEIKREAEGQGTPLILDVTSPFDEKSIDEIEKLVGKNSKLPKWGFHDSHKEGDVSPRYKTDKGFVYYRLQVRKEPYVPGLNDSIRERIVKTKQREQAIARAKQAAVDLSAEVNLRGLAAARVKYRCSKHPSQTSGSPGKCALCSADLERLAVEFKESKEFKLDGRDPSGVAEDSKLAAELNKNAKPDGKPLPIGQARVFEGSQMTGSPKQKWSFIVVMDDIIEKVPENADADFAQRRSGAIERARGERRRLYVNETVARADPKNFMEGAGGEPPPSPEN